MVSLLERMLADTPRLAAAPRRFEAFHLCSVAVILILAVAMILLRRRLPKGERAIRRALVIFGVGLLLLEIGKQMVYSYDSVSGWAYDWSRFPFQFCSTPIYAALVAMCFKDHPLRRALLCFLGTYTPVAGAAVLILPSGDVFHEILFLDVHTMVWHGAMVLFGLYLWLTEAIRPAWKTALRAAAVFVPLNFVALALNEASYAWGFAQGYSFNMFYTGRLGSCYIPVLSQIQDTCPYPVFFLSYVVVLGTGGLLVTVGAMVIQRFWPRKRAETTQDFPKTLA